MTEPSNNAEAIDRTVWTEYECDCGWYWREYGEGHDERGEIDCVWCNLPVSPGASHD